jgi:hypothetical protein
VTIAVTTPTGRVGSHVVRMLCQAGVRPACCCAIRIGSMPNCVTMSSWSSVTSATPTTWPRRPVARRRSSGHTWTAAAAALATATGVSITAQQITDDEQRAALRDAGMGEVAVEGIVGMSVGKREASPRNSRARR